MTSLITTGEGDLLGRPTTFVNVDDLQHLREEMLIFLMSRGNWYQTSGGTMVSYVNVENKVIFFLQWRRMCACVHMCMRACTHVCACGWLAGWFCSCWQSNGSVHCCMWTVMMYEIHLKFSVLNEALTCLHMGENRLKGKCIMGKRTEIAPFCGHHCC